MLNKKIIVGLIILLFLTCGVVSAFDLFGDGLEPEDIYVTRVETGITNYSSVDAHGNGHEDYLYSIFYNLENVSESLKGGEIRVYFYDGNNTVLSEAYIDSNYSSYDINDETFSNNYVPGYGFLHLENFTNVSHCVIEIVKDGNVLFTKKEQFNMSNYEDFDYSDSDDSSDSSDSSSSSSGSGTFVASSSSNKFHDSFCSQAQRISDANKITFSSRDEAINAGYEPCEICYP